MGQLRDRMDAELRLRNFSPRTVDSCLRVVRALAAGIDGPPRTSTPTTSLLHLVGEQRVSPTNQKMHVAGIKFLYREVLARPDVSEAIPWPQVPITLPDVAAPHEILALLDAYRRETMPPGSWIFRGRGGGGPLSTRAVQRELQATVRRAGIGRRLTCHLLPAHPE